MSVQIVQKSGEGLSRVFGVVVPVGDLARKLADKIEEIRPQMNLKGFRPGKVPAAHVKRMYGRQLMGEIVEQAVTEGQTQAMEEARARPAAQPEVKLESDMERVMKGEADLAFDLDVELMPEFEPTDMAQIELKRPVYAPSDEDVLAELKMIAEGSRTYATREGAAEEGDMVIADFIGRIDGEPFEGGKAEDSEIVIGSGRFIPGFEEQLKGASAGDSVLVKATFPEDYNVETLNGRCAEFETTIKEVRAPVEAGEPDDALGQRFGFEDLVGLKSALEAQLQSRFASASRAKAKRALLDVLDERHAFDLPPRMVETEFATIWAQVEAERQSGELSDEDRDKPEEQLRAEYHRIAERRVRLGLVLAEIGRRADVAVTDAELNGALMAEARKFRGQEREVLEYFRRNPQAAATLRAPIYEEKVVDLILSRAKIEDEPVTKEALFEDDAMPAGYADA